MHLYKHKLYFRGNVMMLLLYGYTLVTACCNALLQAVAECSMAKQFMCFQSDELKRAAKLYFAKCRSHFDNLCLLYNINDIIFTVN